MCFNSSSQNLTFLMTTIFYKFCSNRFGSSRLFLHMSDMINQSHLSPSPGSGILKGGNILLVPLKVATPFARNCIWVDALCSDQKSTYDYGRPHSYYFGRSRECPTSPALITVIFNSENRESGGPARPKKNVSPL